MMSEGHCTMVGEPLLDQHMAVEVTHLMDGEDANAYTLMHSKGFPTIQIGKRMVVHRDKLIEWMNDRACA